MGIRETLERNKGPAAGILAACAVVALCVSVYSSRPARMGINTRAYYTDDDGRTYFTDALNKLCPFDHNGRQAYLANVFKCSKGGPFVAYLSRVNDAARPTLERLQQSPGGDRSDEYMRTLNANTEIRRPGETAWAAAGTPAFAQVADFPCPDGGTDPHSVNP